MRKRIYWLLPDLGSARRTMDELLLARLTEHHIHIAATEGAAMSGLQHPHATPQALRWPIFWIGVIGSLGVFDAWRATKHDGSTLSEVTRVLFGTHQPTGRAVFLAALTAGAAVLAAHIIKQV